MKKQIGRLIGDAKLAADGTAERAIGSAQNVAGPGGDRLSGIDTDRIKGVGHQVKGALMQGLGNLVGDTKMVADGLSERGAGKAQNAAGSTRDEVRELVEKRRTETSPTDRADDVKEVSER